MSLGSVAPEFRICFSSALIVDCHAFHGSSIASQYTASQKRLSRPSGPAAGVHAATPAVIVSTGSV